MNPPPGWVGPERPASSPFCAATRRCWRRMLLCSGSRSVLWHPRRAATTAWIGTRTRGRKVNAARLRGGPAVHGHGGRGCGRPLAPPERAYRWLEGADAPRFGALTTPCSSHDQEETDPCGHQISLEMRKRAGVYENENGMPAEERRGRRGELVRFMFHWIPDHGFRLSSHCRVRVDSCNHVLQCLWGTMGYDIYHVTRVRGGKRGVHVWQKDKSKKERKMS